MTASKASIRSIVQFHAKLQAAELDRARKHLDDIGAMHTDALRRVCEAEQRVRETNEALEACE